MDHRLPVVMNGQRYGHGNPISESSADDWALTALHREVDSETERRFDAVGARIAEPFDQRAEEVALIALRSEEHTSELQSLMRNSYAVFCLKKKHNTSHETNQYTFM